MTENITKYIDHLGKKVVYFQDTLGAWAADHFLWETISASQSAHSCEDNTQYSQLDKGFEHAVFSVLKSLETEISGKVSRINLQENTISTKLRKLAEYLGQKSGEETIGIIFVQRRTTTRLLCDFLTRHPLTRDKFRVAQFASAVGHYSKRHDPDDLVDLLAQKETLSKFRNGKFNLLVATNVLEEGIDVQSCNLVISFDLPSNLKGFIQRRGRARQKQSELVLMIDKNDLKTNVEKWQQLEAELIRICQEDRKLEEDQDRDEDEWADLALVHPTTR